MGKVGFNKKFVSNAQARLLKNGEILDVSSFGLSKRDQLDMLKLLFANEKALGNKRIEDWFTPDFFSTNFWHIWTSMFAFQKWSSLAEMRRYYIRFIHLLPNLQKLGGILRTKYNQYDSIALPLENWLREHGVHFDMNTQVTDIDFDIASGIKTATVIHYISNGKEDKIVLRDCHKITWSGWTSLNTFTISNNIRVIRTIRVIRVLFVGFSVKND